MFELYKQGKSTHDIAKDLSMSLRDISIILRKTHVSHGILTTKGNGNNNNKKPPNEKAILAYELYHKGKKPIEVAILLGIPEKKATRHYTEYLKLKGALQVTLLYE